MSVDAETGQTITEVDDNPETMGDQFESAYLYLWVTGQAQALAAMIVYSYLMDSTYCQIHQGNLKRSYAHNIHKLSTHNMRVSWLMTWSPQETPSEIAMERGKSGIGSSEDQRTQRRHAILVSQVLAYVRSRGQDENRDSVFPNKNFEPALTDYLRILRECPVATPRALPSHMMVWE